MFVPLPRLALIIACLLTLAARNASAMQGISVQGRALSDAQVRQLILDAPRIHYPRLSRAVRSKGTGIYEMQIDPGSGKVTQVVILQSAGARLLDIECMRAFGHWRFKPGTLRAVREAVTFRLSWRATMPDYGY